MNNAALRLSLHEHVNQWDIILEWMDEHAEELANGEIPAELEALMDEVGDNINEKIGRTGHVIRNMISMADTAKMERERLERIEKTYRNRAERLKGYLLYEMGRLGQDKIETPFCKVRVQRNSLPSLTPAGDRFMVERTEKVFDREAAAAYVQAVGAWPTAPTKEPVHVDGVVVELKQHVRVA